MVESFVILVSIIGAFYLTKTIFKFINWIEVGKWEF